MIRREFTGIVLSVSKVSPDNLLRHTVRFQSGEDIPEGGVKTGDVVEMQGVISPVIIRQGTHLRITAECPDHGMQGARIIKAAIILSESNVIQFLATGAIADITRTVADRIVSHFGPAAIDALNEAPERIREVSGISDSARMHIEANWIQHSKIAPHVIETMSVGLSATTARRVVEMFGASSADKLADNQYLLSYVQGYGFVRADNFAAMHGIAQDCPIRIQAAMWHCLNIATHEGHTYLPSHDLNERTSDLTKIDINIVKEVPFPDTLMESHNRVYIKEIYDAERYVATKIRIMSYQPTGWQLSRAYIQQILDSNTTLTQEQQQALYSILSGTRINVITGLPGTGKTTLIKSIVSAMKCVGLRYALAAPTGKAANRITEQTGYPASTIHRLLGISRDGNSARNQDNLLQTDCLIVDESSMLDVFIMQQILSALPDKAALILVGDSNQLPAIGPGKILKEIKDRNICNVLSLSQIHRQAKESRIIRLSHAIHMGVMPFDVFASNECKFIIEDDPEKIKDKIIEIVSTHPEYPPERIQVLTPMKKGVIGANQLNAAIKRKIKGYSTDFIQKKGYAEPQSHQMASTFEVGDRVIQKTNNYQKSVFNGEIGYVVMQEPSSGHGTGKIMVLFDDLKEVTYAEHETYQLDYAWALTVHKAQGAQYPCIVMPLHTSHYIMLFRSLIYTAVTRAEKTVIMVGSTKAAVLAVKNNRQDTRYTNLSEIDL